MLMQIEMFSKAETIIFGVAMVAFVLATLILYLVIDACGRLIKARNDKEMLERNVSRVYEVDKNEFAELGEAAIRNQRMQSFIAETSTGRRVEVTVDDILKEVKERKKNES